MERTAELCAPDDEAEALAIEAELRDHGVPPILVRAASAGLPGVTDRARWGTIRVPEADLDRARAILTAWYERDDDELEEDELERQALEAEEIDEDRRRELEAAASPYRGPDYPKRVVPRAEPARAFPIGGAIAAISIVINVVLAALLLREPSAEIDGTVEQQDAHGRLQFEWEYRRGEHQPSVGRAFDTNGRATHEWTDRDADGREERTRTFARDGRALTTAHDRDEDGRVERVETHGPGGAVTSAWRDGDDDGWPETIEVGDELVIEDADHDGVFERYRCRSAREQRPIVCD